MGQSSPRCISWLLQRRFPDISVLLLANHSNSIVIFKYFVIFFDEGAGVLAVRVYAVLWNFKGRSTYTGPLIKDINLLVVLECRP